MIYNAMTLVEKIKYIGGTFYSSEEEIIQDTINKITNTGIKVF